MTDIDKEAIRARWRPGNAVLGPAAFADIAALLDALDERDRQRNAALALHLKVEDEDVRAYYCPECGQGYPCPTGRALGVTA